MPTVYQLPHPEPTLRQRLGARISELLWRRDFEFCEVISGGAMVAFALVLLMPWSTFGTGLAYAAMAALAPEWAWGGFCFWVGFTQLGALLLDQRRVRMAAALGACMLWAFTAFTLGWANPYGASVGIFPWFALASAWAYLRIVRGSA